MGQQALFHLVAVRCAASVADEQIADDSLALLINEKRIAENAAPLNRRVSGQDLGVHVAQDHLRRARVIPRQQPRPGGDLILQQGAKVGGRKMPEIEDFQGAPGGISEMPIAV